MKLFTIVYLAIMMYLCAGCGKVQCTSTPDLAFRFENTSFADTVTDTGVSVGKYDKGTNFAALVDTVTPYSIYGYPSPKFTFNIAVGKDFYNYDYLITLFPSNRQYKLRALFTHQGHIPSPIGFMATSCTNALSFVLNDSAYTIPQENFSYGTEVDVRY